MGSKKRRRRRKSRKLSEPLFDSLPESSPATSTSSPTNPTTPAVTTPKKVWPKRTCLACGELKCFHSFHRGLRDRCKTLPRAEELMLPKNEVWDRSRRTNGGLPAEWTRAEPGSAEKIRVMCDRDTAGFVPNHPLDRKWNRRRRVVTEGPGAIEVLSRPRATEVEVIVCDDGEMRSVADVERGKAAKGEKGIGGDGDGGKNALPLPKVPTWKEVHSARLRHAEDLD